jgi:t-SNARE complex subunit (syntaxin)
MDNSLQTLEGELEQLLNLFRDFNELVHAQQPMIDQFEEKVLAAEEQTKSAVTELATVHL